MHSKKMVLTYIITILILVNTSCAEIMSLENDHSRYIENAMEKHYFILSSFPNNNNTIFKDRCDREFLVKLPIEYDYISDFQNDYALLSKNNDEAILYKNDLLISPTSEYDVISVYEEVVCIKSVSNSSYGLADINGKLILEPTYSKPFIFSEGLAIVQKDDKIGYINVYGDVVIDFEYNWGLSFHDGVAAVGKGDVFWFIDNTGSALSGPYPNLGSEVLSFSPAYMDYYEGYTAYFEANNTVNPFGYNTGGYWGFLDKNGGLHYRQEVGLYRSRGQNIIQRISWRFF